MLKIYLIRHGQDLDNAEGILNGRRNQPLTQKGIEQAREVANIILSTKLSFDRIYSSPLRRAYCTAKIIANKLGLPEPTTLDGLIERDFGIMTGMPITSIEKRCFPDIIKTNTICYFLNPLRSETFPQLLERAEKIINFVNEEHKEGNVLLATHGDIGKMIYTAYYKLEWKKVLSAFHFGNSEILELSKDKNPENAFLTKIEQHNL